MGREVVQVQGHVARPPEDVWRILRDFCGAWHPWVATMAEERGPQGARVRSFTVTGEDTVYREQQTYFSDSDRVLGYTHLEGIRDCEAYDARVTVTPAADGGAHVGWSATIRAPAGRLTAIAEGTKAVFEAGIEAILARAGQLIFVENQASAALACAAMALNASGSCTARSARTLRSTSIPALARPLMKRE